MIKRHILNLIKQTVKTFPVTLLTGPRQVGKSTLLNYLFNDKSFKYITFDEFQAKQLASSNPNIFLSENKYPLIIDEVQLVPTIFNEINTVVNRSKMTRGNKKSNGMYILSGSNKADLLDKSKESLAGRMAYLDMLPLSLNEILDKDAPIFDFDEAKIYKRSIKSNMSEKELFEYIFKGFLPGLYDNEGTNLSIFYSSYIQSYIEKDLKAFVDVTNSLQFREFITILASNIGQELIYSDYAKKVGVCVNTIKSWISALCKTGVIYLLRPYNESSISKQVVKRPKMYFFDTGLAAFLCKIPDAKTLQNSIYKGRFFECFVVNELRKSFNNNGLFPTFYYYRDNSQTEVDLVYPWAGKLNKIEIKCGNRFDKNDSKNLNELKSKLYPKSNKAIICSGNNFYRLDDNTLIIPFSVI